MRYYLLYSLKLPLLPLGFASELKSKIRDIVQRLHDNDLVHGDIRDTNILVDLETSSYAVQLLDFDWAGTEGEVRYPERVNTKSIRRPDGVSDRELITKDHDTTMVGHLLT
jgi:serine/threonine protein kinase